jgi:hypothetical protein
MYIRRKVFSVLQDESGEERLFSTTEYLDESLFSKDDEEEELTGADKKMLRKIALKDRNEKFAIPGAAYAKAGLMGGLLGHIVASATKKSFNTRKGRLIGSGIGALAGIGAEHLAKKKVEKDIDDYYKSSDGDLKKVADGKMSKKAYIKKHYNQAPEQTSEE